MRVRYTDHIVGTDGKFGQAVFGQWRGQEVARRYVVPHDPRTDAQLEQRILFSNGAHAWRSWASYVAQKNLTTNPLRDAWQFPAFGRPVTAQNLFMARWIEDLKTATSTRLFLWPYVNTDMPAPTNISHTVDGNNQGFHFNIRTWPAPADFTFAGLFALMHNGQNPKTTTWQPVFDIDYEDAYVGQVSWGISTPLRGELSVVVMVRYTSTTLPNNSPIKHQYSTSPVTTLTLSG